MSPVRAGTGLIWTWRRGGPRSYSGAMRKTIVAIAGLFMAACGSPSASPSGKKMYRVWDRTRSAPVTDWIEDKEKAEQARKEYEKRFPHNIVQVWTR